MKQTNHSQNSDSGTEASGETGAADGSSTGDNEDARSRGTPDTGGPQAGHLEHANGHEHDLDEGETHAAGTSGDRQGWLQRLFSMRRNPASTIRDDLSDALASSASSGDFTPEEKQMIHNVLRLQDVRVEDLMVPRAEIEAVELDITLGELLALFESSGHSRMPVYSETLDDPRGMVHIRDVVGYITKTAADRSKRQKTSSAALDLSKVDLARELGKLNLVRTVLFVPPSMFAADLMARMQATRIQMALVIDEYGGTEGLISLEDIVEIIVGDIEDEHDDEDVLIQVADDGVLICDARAEIDDINETLGGMLNVGEHGDDADTIGGVIFSLLGRIPVKGEVVEAFGYEFRIKDADPRRIRTIEMVRSKKAGLRKAPAKGRA